MAVKDYLGYEHARNKRNAAVYERLIKLAFQHEGASIMTLTGHHLTFELNGDLQTENEIPSADCMMFDHDIMTRVFGRRAIPLMMRLASVPCDIRDEILRSELEALRNVQAA